MEDHSVGRLLREIPRETARTGFTTRVLARLDPLEGPAPERPRAAWRPRLAFAAAAVLALVVSAGLFRYEQSREAARAAEARQALREIRAEHERLEQELRALSEPPVVYLGGNERIDLVLGLDNIPAEAGPAPATYRSDTF
jgi:cytochrome c-type biogenesis protein CcmH/NrfG